MIKFIENVIFSRAWTVSLLLLNTVFLVAGLACDGLTWWTLFNTLGAVCMLVVLKYDLDIK